MILGKVNMTEFANYMSRDGMPSGYSSRGGQVLNPYNRGETPSGSSSGSGVAVAAGLCSCSVGTETVGSIVSPSAANGIVGIKPTLGLAGRSGIIPISSTLDTPGPMARCVRDAAILLGVLADADPHDPAAHGYAGRVNTDYTKFLVQHGLKGVKIGVVKLGAEDGEENDAFGSLLKAMSGAGAKLIEGLKIDNDIEARKPIMKYEFKACMNHYLSTLHTSTPVKTLREIILFNQINAETALKYGQSLLTDCEYQTTGRMTEPEYLRALIKRDETIKHLNEVFEESGADVLLCDSFAKAAPFTGFPSMTVPIGQRKDGLPIGSNWIAKKFDEGVLLAVGYAVEQLLGLELRPNI